MKKLLLLSILFYGLQLSAQTTFSNDVYKGKFSNTLHVPLWVSYTLYKGGGECSRDGIKFINDKPELQTATDDDYANNTGPYDKGHLCNAEDFANDCHKDSLTFRYYNCLPQTTKLNRGIWKSNETQIRDWSKTQKLFIICGGWFSNKKMHEVAVPDYCWKVVQSYKTKEVLFCGWFSNTKNARVEEIMVTELEKRLKSKLNLMK